MSDPLKLAKEKAARVAKPIPVDVPGIGRLFVRPRLMGERDDADEALKDGDFNTVCLSVARLLCSDDGTRPVGAVIAEWAAVFMELPQSDVILIGNASDGNAKDKPASDPGN